MSKQDGGALRYNKGKLPMHLVPPSAIKALAEVLDYGANKYAERNWERGFNYSIPYACAMRHLLKWWSGETHDDESGLNHLKHVLINIAMLIEFTESYPEGDDRPYKEPRPATEAIEEMLNDMAEVYDTEDMLSKL